MTTFSVPVSARGTGIFSGGPCGNQGSTLSAPSGQSPCALGRPGGGPFCGQRGRQNAPARSPPSPTRNTGLLLPYQSARCPIRLAWARLNIELPVGTSVRPWVNRPKTHALQELGGSEFRQGSAQQGWNCHGSCRVFRGGTVECLVHDARFPAEREECFQYFGARRGRRFSTHR